MNGYRELKLNIHNSISGIYIFTIFDYAIRSNRYVWSYPTVNADLGCRIDEHIANNATRGAIQNGWLLQPQWGQVEAHSFEESHWMIWNKSRQLFSTFLTSQKILGLPNVHPKASQLECKEILVFGHEWKHFFLDGHRL